ncbi:hypothetical protein GQE99_12380 [Maritimibacter sp. DP07]|uniref:Uncharacterized protein n=1 Tax=Maritimibacter harenae TaxID=2606218 RepID=A0A845MAK1_9RHOB|nr:hypothetical protein [Maritimibacter harenae]MZR13811.1 hypothetical protein [Maritimibacter harenae]
MPARVGVNGDSFVEFASRKEEARALEELLSTLGFERTGRHRIKAVTLWKEGDVRMVVNEETKGRAGATFNARGTTVCDIGLWVEDAQAVTALGTEPFSQPTGPSELDIPAIRAIPASSSQRALPHKKRLKRAKGVPAV